MAGGDRTSVGGPRGGVGKGRRGRGETQTKNVYSGVGVGGIVVRVSTEVTNQTRATARIFDALWFLTFFSCLAMYVWKKKEWC